MAMTRSLFLTVMAMLCWACVAPAQSAPDSGWPNYGNDAGGTRYSAARQIDRTNVAQLKVAWTYRTGAMQQQTEMIRKAAFEATPILVENKLFLSTPYNHVLALNPQDGQKLWEYDPQVDLSHDYSEVSSRGVSAWHDPKAKPGQPCRLRIFIGTLDGRLIALDGETGKPCLDFGAKGEVNLARDAATAPEYSGGYQVTSAPAIAKDLVITGSSIADNWKVDTGRGIVRAFDARTGQLRWTWNPAPWAEQTEPRTGAANAWSTLSVDAKKIWSLCPPAAPPRTTMAAFAKAMTSGPTPWLLYARPRESSSGASRLFTMTCGTTTSPRSPRCSPGKMARRRSLSIPRWATYLCSTGLPVFPCCRWRSGRSAV